MTSRAELIAIVDAADLPVGAVRALLRDGDLIVVDDELAETTRIPLPIPRDARLLAVDAEAALVVASAAEGLWIASSVPAAEAIHVPIAADNAVILTDGRIVASVPVRDDGEDSAQSYRLLLIDPNGAVLDEANIDAEGAFPRFTPHPSLPVVIVDFVTGQDGSTILQVEHRDGHLRITEILRSEDIVTASFDPDGGRILATPYPFDPERALVIAWPELDVVAHRDATELGAPMGWNVYGGYLDRDRILLLAVEHGLFVLDANLQGAQQVELIDLDQCIGEDGFIESVQILGGETFATVLWDEGDRTTTVWRMIP